ncbi:unnamed protein product [Debaryomyces tyrocola]|nr:unnamed protein product [Debaryomyces tyrocola]
MFDGSKLELSSFWILANNVGSTARRFMVGSSKVISLLSSSENYIRGIAISPESCLYNVYH